MHQLTYKTTNLYENLDVLKPHKLRTHRLCKNTKNSETQDDSCQFLIRPQKYRRPLLQIIQGKKPVLWAQLWTYLLGIWPPAGITITFVIRLSGGAAHNSRGIVTHWRPIGDTTRTADVQHSITPLDTSTQICQRIQILMNICCGSKYILTLVVKHLSI